MTVTGISGAELIALGHAAIAKSHELILLGGVLGLLSIVAGLISRRVGAPMLLVLPRPWHARGRGRRAGNSL